ncbi:MAG: hypothetical protein ACK55I_23950, partial [bacterium]
MPAVQLDLTHLEQQRRPVAQLHPQSLAHAGQRLVDAPLGMQHAPLQKGHRVAIGPHHPAVFPQLPHPSFGNLLPIDRVLRLRPLGGWSATIHIQFGRDAGRPPGQC